MTTYSGDLVQFEISEDTTYYVDGDNGNDANDGLSLSNAKKTLDFLYSGGVGAIPRCINADVTVNVSGSVLSTGTAYHTVLDSFYGVGSLTVLGTTTDVDTSIAITGQDNTSSSITYHSYLDASGESFSVNAHRGQFLQITGGTGAGSTLYPIISNTDTRLESTNLPDTDGTTVIKIVSLPKLKGAQVSAPEVTVDYSDEEPFNVVGTSLLIDIKNLDVTDVTASDVFSVRYTDNKIRIYSCVFACSPLFYDTARLKLYSSMFILDSYAYVQVVERAYAEFIYCAFTSTDDSGYGLYCSCGTAVIADGRFNRQYVCYQGDRNGVCRFYGTSVLFDESTIGILGIQGDIIIHLYGASKYANFKNVTTAISLGGARFNIGDGCTFQADTVTTEVLISDAGSDTAAFSDLNAQTTIQNTATGAVVGYMNHSTYIPIQNPEYDNSASGLSANSFQAAIDELKALIDGYHP